jgi:hypothetical protein
MDDRLKFTGSIRYDKAQNYDGMFRLGCLLYILVVKVGDITLGSFQTGFRNPTTRPVHRILMCSAILLGSNQIT